MIRRRHVIYVEGYDPQGAEGYYGLFARGWKRAAQIWRIDGKLGELKIESRDFARWDLEAAGPNWRVATRYDFLRQEHVIRANMAEPLRRQVPRALAWAFDYLVTGTLVRVLRANWRFGLVLIYFQSALIWWLELAAAGGWLSALAAERLLGLPGLVAAAIGVTAAPLLFRALRPVADYWFVRQINNHWPHLCTFARGEPSCFDASIEACARRVVESVAAGGVDEVLVIGHSGGGALAPAVVVRALELDPDVGRRGPPLVLLTLGSIAPGAALHPKAVAMRATVARLATEPSVRWIDCQARKDVLNFWDFDPVEGIGVHVGPERCNPVVWNVRFRDVLLEERYLRIRMSFFRMHYQFIMGNDRTAPYDYFMLVGGPVPAMVWSGDSYGVMTVLEADGTYGAGHRPVTVESE